MEFTSGFDTETLTTRIVSYGHTGSGKTRFGLTLPKRIGLLPLESNSIVTWRKFMMEHKWLREALLTPKVDMTGVSIPEGKTEEEEEELTIAHYSKLFKQLQIAARGLVERGVRSVVIDSGTELFDVACNSVIGRKPRFGDDAKDLSPINTLLRNYLHLFRNQNLLVTHHTKLEFKSPIPGKKAIPTGNSLADGWKRIGYASDIEIEHMRVSDDADVMNVKVMWHRKVRVGDYVALIKKAHGNPYLVRNKEGLGVLKNGEINFANLVLRVWPDSDLVRDWGFDEEEVERWLGEGMEEE